MAKSSFTAKMYADAHIENENMILDAAGILPQTFTVSTDDVVHFDTDEAPVETDTGAEIEALIASDETALTADEVEVLEALETPEGVEALIDLLNTEDVVLEIQANPTFDEMLAAITDEAAIEMAVEVGKAIDERADFGPRGRPLQRVCPRQARRCHSWAQLGERQQRHQRRLHEVAVPLQRRGQGLHGRDGEGCRLGQDQGGYGSARNARPSHRLCFDGVDPGVLHDAGAHHPRHRVALGLAQEPDLQPHAHRGRREAPERARGGDRRLTPRHRVGEGAFGLPFFSPYVTHGDFRNRCLYVQVWMAGASHGGGSRGGAWCSQARPWV